MRYHLWGARFTHPTSNNNYKIASKYPATQWRSSKCPTTQWHSSKTPPHSGTVACTPPHSGTVASAPPHSGTVACTPPHSGTVASTPPHSGTVASTPPHSGAVASTPPHSGTVASTPPHSGTVAWVILFIVIILTIDYGYISFPLLFSFIFLNYVSQPFLSPPPPFLFFFFSTFSSWVMESFLLPLSSSPASESLYPSIMIVDLKVCETFTFFFVLLWPSFLKRMPPLLDDSIPPTS